MEKQKEKTQDEWREYWRDHKQKHKTKYAAIQQEWRKIPRNRLKQLCCAQGRICNRSELNFDELLKRAETNNWCCEITGIPFVFDTPRHPRTLSIDRIDPNKGYTNDNVRLICWWLNCALGTWGLDQLKELIKESNFAS